MKVVLSVVLAFFILGCSEDTTGKSQKAKTKLVLKEAPKVVKEAKEVVVVEETTEVVAEIDGKTIYKVCSSCHGANGEKAALGKSQIIKGWDVIKTTNALKGYRDGTYGGAMKSLMAGQVKSLNEVDMNIVAEYISKL